MPVMRVQLFVEHTENNKNLLLPDSAWRPTATCVQVMPDDHSKSVPPLPIPNRTVKRLYADDSADSRVKVGNRQAKRVVARLGHTTNREEAVIWGCVYRTRESTESGAHRAR